jgi:hypothetical protein
MKNKTILKIKTEKLGYLNEVTGFLNELEDVYNHLFAFNFFYETILFESERLTTSTDITQESIDNILKKSYNIERRIPQIFYTDHLFFLKFIREVNEIIRPTILTSLIEEFKKTKVQDLLLPDDKLLLISICIESPGFWEFLGSINPLEQIRKYLNDRHERIKDKKFRDRQEENYREIEIQILNNKDIKEKIEILEKIGCTKIEIRELIGGYVVNPLHRLDKYQNNGQIENSIKDSASHST